MTATTAPSGGAAAPRVGLVLGAGGYLGAAWLAGALVALHEETGWDPRTADYVVGTSAGAIIGALCALGKAPAAIADRMAAPTSDDDGWWRAEHRRAWPGSPTLGIEALRHPRGQTAIGLLAGWLPRGRYSTLPLKQLMRGLAPGGWSERPGVWVIACDYRTGARTVFRSESDRRVELADAVAASCAVPGVYCPVEIDGREFADGALRSSSNLDVVSGLDLDVVICLSPASAHTADEPRRLRRPASRRVAREAAIVAGAGIDVTLIEPTRRDVQAIGWNQLARNRAPEVVHTAVATTREQILYSAVGVQLAQLSGTGAQARPVDTRAAG
jgi:NTE family protein